MQAVAIGTGAAWQAGGQDAAAMGTLWERALGRSGGFKIVQDALHQPWTLQRQG